MKNYKQFTLQIAKQAGAIIRANFRPHMAKEFKKDGSPLTKTDLAVNTLVIENVKKHYPGHSVLAEEENYASRASEFVWVCDPIDGTIPFSHGIPLSTFTMALVHNGEPIMGVIMDPFGKNTYFAEQGKGAYLNNQRIKVSKRATLVSSVVSMEHWRQAPYDSLALVKALENKNCSVPIFKSIAYSGGLIASGEIVGLVFPAKTPWDIAATKIIVEEAGGKTTDLHGNKQKYNQAIKGFVASNGLVHNELLRLIQKHVFNK